MSGPGSLWEAADTTSIQHPPTDLEQSLHECTQVEERNRSNSNCNMVDDVNSASSADCRALAVLEPDFRQAAFLPLEYNRLVPSGMLPSLINIDRTCWMLLSEGGSKRLRQDLALDAPKLRRSERLRKKQDGVRGMSSMQTELNV
ncbi:hypothetical protein L227DRAFT_617672 [Lentinus tigrinus ALCF2SS1-6]|uniref:Uncharacterized protein n=1 Tax=Lentinus tigrinus ALCF2SS1-6 TaxID=1328759 RepID=A0A5C2RNW9_9APHY|nr:hypothetical protein L227DRAFT_617672 [Lentinus tigrinus ALCF2SS1-6]